MNAGVSLSSVKQSRVSPIYGERVCELCVAAPQAVNSNCKGLPSVAAANYNWVLQSVNHHVALVDLLYSCPLRTQWQQARVGIPNPELLWQVGTPWFTECSAAAVADPWLHMPTATETIWGAVFALHILQWRVCCSQLQSCMFGQLAVQRHAEAAVESGCDA